jgi:type I restriction enzyme M protein
LLDFTKCYRPDDPARRKESANFRRFSYPEIVAREKANLDFQWKSDGAHELRNESPQMLLNTIVADLEDAMKEFAAAELAIRPKTLTVGRRRRAS